MEEKKASVGGRVFCGSAVGIANSLFGGGGGMLAVPLLQKNGYDGKSAHATAILVILPVSFLSFLFYFLRGFYDFSVLIPTALGVSVGGALGAQFLGKLPEKTVAILFSILQAIAGAFLFFR
ncbi:MAG: sulfite exporter TauE/SafE family protein [Clostridiales bacterium]|nr:sulfite exporter TauE/SafE family protein [Clostridiales bacterium]